MSVPPDDVSRGFSRRSFLKGASVAAVATSGAAAGAAPAVARTVDEPTRIGPGATKVEP